jgi:hypothetical protein
LTETRAASNLVQEAATPREAVNLALQLAEEKE